MHSSQHCVNKQQIWRSYLRVDSKHRLCETEQCRKRKEWVLEIKTHAEDLTVTLFKNLDIHMYALKP